MNMLDWAKREVEIACKRERKTSKMPEDDWDYGCACYESALKAFNSLMEDGHSGTSIGSTKNILMRLIEGKVLTPIEDTEDIWRFSHKNNDGTYVYQCTRMSSLFKDIHPDGSVIYHDIDRCYCVSTDNPDIPYHNGFISNIFDEMYPITMPYISPTRAAKIVREEFLFNPKNGDWDTMAILYLINFDGEKVEVNRYFKETGDSFVEIDKHEYEMRKMIAERFKGENDND